MAMQTRIKQRFDPLSSWNQNDIVLLRGELAVVDCGSQIRFKIGDGTKSFTQLPFVDQSQLCTHWIATDAISQGLHAKSVPYGFAAGAYLCANANFSQALGFDAQTISSDTYSFVWNGDDTRAIGDYYSSHGKGTFSLNPLSGTAGVFIGDESLSSLLDDASEGAVPAIFRNVQLVKPQQQEGYRLHFRGDIARDDQFEDLVVQDFDSATQERWQFFKHFVADGLSGTWETMLSNGFYTDADDVPASFYFADALSSLGEEPKISSQYFLRYFWYYELSGVERRSDQFSIAIPSNTAVGANPGDVIHRGEFYDLKQTVQPLKQTISKETEYNRYYICKPMVISEITGSLTGSFDVLLDDYEASQIYRFQFTVGASDATPTFYVDYGNGPEVADTLKVNTDSYIFKAGKSYYIELQGDVLKVDTLGYAESGSDVVVDQVLYSGTKIATISVDGSPTDIYAPNPGSNVSVDAILTTGTQIASISVGNQSYDLYAPTGGGGSPTEPYRYPLITAQLTSVGGSLCCLVEDHAVTTIEVSSASTPLIVKLPPKPAGNGSRDFILRIEVSSSTAPGITFAGLDESITFDSDSDDWMTIEPGLNLISFTETR